MQADSIRLQPNTMKHLTTVALPRIERNKLVALITIEVHARDVQDRMIVPLTQSMKLFDTAILWNYTVAH